MRFGISVLVFGLVLVPGIGFCVVAVVAHLTTFEWLVFFPRSPTSTKGCNAAHTFV